MATIKKLAIETISNKYQPADNNGSWIRFQTSLTNNGEYSKLVKLAKAAKELAGNDLEVCFTKRDLLSYITDRKFISNSAARGYFCSYFAFLNKNDIVVYDSLAKAWKLGTRINEFFKDVDFFKSNNTSK